MKKIIKKIKFIATIGMALILVIYLIMFLSTNSVMRELESVFLLEVENSETIGRAINFFNRHDSLANRDAEIGEVYLTLRRSIFHNFFTGRGRINYTRRVYDEYGNLMTGASGVLARIRIERIDDDWEITEACEWLNSWKSESLFCYE